ncbi:hypothetical protein MXB_2860, partial [Myxobolus squamalis]
YHFSDIKVLKIVSTGAYGYCYKGLIKNQRKTVLVKIIKYRGQSRKLLYKSFKNEIQRILSFLDHPNIVRYLGFGYQLVDKNIEFFILTEFVNGSTLKDIIYDVRINLPKKSVLKYSIEIASALEYIHSLGIYHMDIKPNNIVVDKKTDKCIIIDFGSSIINNQNCTSLLLNKVT